MKGENTLLDNFMRKIYKMQFIDTDELYHNIDTIKEMYNGELLNNDEKMIYKWYFFNQLCLLRWKSKYSGKYIKDTMWHYINNIESKENVTLLYKEFCAFRINMANKNKKHV